MSPRMEELNQPCDVALLDLLAPTSEPVAPSNCQVGKLYWGSGRDGELAICQGYDTAGVMRFSVWINDRGVDKLSLQAHTDDEARTGTWRPFVELEDAPQATDEIETLTWLLEKTIELKTARIEWLRRLPAHLQNSRHYPGLLEQEQANLSGLRQVQTDGFSQQTAPGYFEIMEVRRLALL